jgi:hypothetical protein
MNLDSLQQPKKKLAVADGASVVLIDMLGQPTTRPWEDVNRNVCLVAADGHVVWQIETASSEEERFPYTNIYFDEAGGLRAYCWDGGDYAVNLHSGRIDRGTLSR